MKVSNVLQSGIAMLSLAVVTIATGAFALDFLPDTVFLDITNEEDCTTLGAGFTEWDGETYCTTNEINPINTQQQSLIDSAGQKIVSLIDDNEELFDRVIFLLEKYKQRFIQDQSIRKYFIMQELAKSIEGEFSLSSETSEETTEETSEENTEETTEETTVQKHKRLQVNGSYVTAENGEKISLAGMSLFWSTAEDVTNFYNAETIDFLADEWEIDIIRTAMGVKESWDGGRGYVDSPDTQKEMIKNVIDAAIANDIYVIVDWHTHYAENYIDEAVTFFSEISEEYGHNDHIIYEIYNEPIWQSWDTIKSYSEIVIDAIRENDPDNLIIVGSGEWSQRVDNAAANPIDDDNVAYTLHFYAGTHGQFLRDRASQAMEDGIAIFVTEWGTVSADGNGGVNTSETNAWIDFMQGNHISHANWSVGDKNESSAIINLNQGIEGLKNNDLTTSGILVKSIIQDK